jgi:hypothetical protein
MDRPARHFGGRIALMKRIFSSLLAFALFACASAPPPAPPPASPSAAELSKAGSEVMAFVKGVEAGIAQRGPAAWRDYFSELPTFFMVVDGKVAFAGPGEATRGIAEVAKNITRIELQWGVVRVDVLSPQLSSVGAPYHEVQVWADGHQVTEDGYFTGLAERGKDGWRFRNAHWSSARAR